MPRQDPYKAGYSQGLKDGRTEARKEVLDWFEAEFMKPEVEIVSVWGRSILEVVNKAAKHFRELTASGK